MKDAEYQKFFDAEPPVVLNPSRAKWLGILLIDFIFLAIDGWDMAQGGRSDWILWFGLVFWGLGAGLSLLLVFGPNMNALLLQSNEFTINAPFGRKRTWQWKVVSDFVPRPLRGVGFNDESTSKWAKRSRKLTGFNCMLPTGYKLTDVQLAYLMNFWRVRALAENLEQHE